MGISGWRGPLSSGDFVSKFGKKFSAVLLKAVFVVRSSIQYFLVK